MLTLTEIIAATYCFGAAAIAGSPESVGGDPAKALTRSLTAAGVVTAVQRALETKTGFACTFELDPPG